MRDSRFRNDWDKDGCRHPLIPMYRRPILRGVWGYKLSRLALIQFSNKPKPCVLPTWRLWTTRSTSSRPWDNTLGWRYRLRHLCPLIDTLYLLGWWKLWKFFTVNPLGYESNQIYWNERDNNWWMDWHEKQSQYELDHLLWDGPDPKFPPIARTSIPGHLHKGLKVRIKKSK